MTDLTDKLRGVVATHLAPLTRQHALDAADEIDRLSAENACLTACVESANKYLETKDPEAALAVLLRVVATKQ